jgi:hypothetical protein
MKMVTLKVLAVVSLAGGVLTEVAGAHPGGWGFIANAGAVLALVFWVLSWPARQPRAEQERRMQ